MPRRLIALLAGIAAVIALATVALRSCQSASTAKIQARVANGVAGSAIGTAIDGSKAAANAADQRASDLKNVEDTLDEIRAANTAAAANDAGLAGLHRLDHPR